nr:hypothetical protein [Tanacetum cinerariifolium]
EAKGNSPVKSFTGYRDLSAEFEDYSDNSINEVNAAGTIVPTVRQNSLNNTNTFSAAEFEYCSNNSSNEVNAAGTIVPTVGQNFSNGTNSFSAVGPSNTTASPTYRKSSFIDACQLFDDPDMPKLEDITYSDNENDVGAEEEPERTR